MSHKSLEQSLVNLLPGIAEEPPQELVKLASYLLAQSRSYGSSLKPEMEIARPYACAEIACKRLAKTLKLPPTVSRPPCAPAIYKKLHKYLEQSLSNASAGSKSRTAETQRRASARIQSKQNSTPIATTTTPLKRPTTRSALAPNKKSLSGVSPLKRTNGRTPASSGLKSKQLANDAPSWTMPLIRQVCSALSTAAPSSTPFSRPKFSMALSPHIFAGVSSILNFVTSAWPDEPEDEYKKFFSTILIDDRQPKAGERGQDEGEEQIIYREQITALVIAVYFIVYLRKSAMLGDDPILARLDEHIYNDMAKTAIASVDLPDVCASGEKSTRVIDTWIMLIIKRGWTVGQEWFENVPIFTKDEMKVQFNEGDDNNNNNKRPRRNEDGYDGEDDDEEGDIVVPTKRRRNRKVDRQMATIDEDRHGCNQGLLPGLRTMMHDQIDWLSEEKRRDFEGWKVRIMQLVGEIESLDS